MSPLNSHNKYKLLHQSENHEFLEALGKRVAREHDAGEINDFQNAMSMLYNPLTVSNAEDKSMIEVQANFPNQYMVKNKEPIEARID